MKFPERVGRRVIRDRSLWFDVLVLVLTPAVVIPGVIFGGQHAVYDVAFFILLLTFLAACKNLLRAFRTRTEAPASETPGHASEGSDLPDR